jgi:hypothetical protein
MELTRPQKAELHKDLVGQVEWLIKLAEKHEARCQEFLEEAQEWVYLADLVFADLMRGAVPMDTTYGPVR